MTAEVDYHNFKIQLFFPKNIPINDVKPLELSCGLNKTQQQLAINLWFKVFKNHYLRTDPKPIYKRRLFPEEISKKVISFLCTQNVGIIDLISDRLNHKQQKIQRHSAY